VRVYHSCLFAQVSNKKLNIKNAHVAKESICMIFPLFTVKTPSEMPYQYAVFSNLLYSAAETSARASSDSPAHVERCEGLHKSRD